MNNDNILTDLFVSFQSILPIHTSLTFLSISLVF
jgi:hypothetical protein